MTKYLHEERFVVTSQDKEALRKYAEGWERTFGGDKSDEKQDPCFVCGATDHERVEAFGGTVQGCPQVPANVLLAAPDTDAIECKLNSYANYIVQGPAVSIPVDEICEGCDELTCECDEHDPACAKLCTFGAACDCGRFTRI